MFFRAIVCWQLYFYSLNSQEGGKLPSNWFLSLQIFHPLKYLEGHMIQAEIFCFLDSSNNCLITCVVLQLSYLLSSGQFFSTCLSKLCLHQNHLYQSAYKEKWFWFVNFFNMWRTMKFLYFAIWWWNFELTFWHTYSPLMLSSDFCLKTQQLAVNISSTLYYAMIALKKRVAWNRNLNNT